MLEAAAVGVPDRYVGEDVVAFAVLRGRDDCAERELLGYCEDRLGRFTTPSRIHFVRDLPKGPSGKVQRLQLHEEAAERLLPRARRRTQQSAQVRIPAARPIEQIIAETWVKSSRNPPWTLRAISSR